MNNISSDDLPRILPGCGPVKVAKNTFGGSDVSGQWARSSEPRRGRAPQATGLAGNMFSHFTTATKFIQQCVQVSLTATQVLYGASSILLRHLLISRSTIAVFLPCRPSYFQRQILSMRNNGRRIFLAFTYGKSSKIVVPNHLSLSLLAGGLCRLDIVVTHLLVLVLVVILKLEIAQVIDLLGSHC